MARKLFLPLLLVVLLSHLASSTPATDDSSPLTKLFKEADAKDSSSSAPAPAPAPLSSDPSNNKQQQQQQQQDGDKNGTVLVSWTNGTGLYKGMAREFVDGHNKIRERYGAPPLTWDNKLARHARRWAKAMRKDCVIMHSVSDYGESVFVGRNGWNATAKDALWMWTQEEPAYDRVTGKCLAGHHFKECGHFALMVNKENRRLGCGRAECFQGHGVFISCNYFF